MKGAMGRVPAASSIVIELTAEQARDFAACAEVAGLTIERWIVECAQVKAADVIDAVQATERQARAEIAAEPGNTRNRERNRVRARLPKAPPPPESEVMAAARAFNARFRTRTKR